MLLSMVVARVRQLLSLAVRASRFTSTRYKRVIEEDNKANVGGLENSATELLRAGQVEAAADIFRQLHGTPPGRDLVIKVVQDALLDSKRPQADEPYVVSLDDVEVDTGYWVVLDRQKVYVKETYGRNFSNSPLVQGRASPDYSKYIVAYSPSNIHLEEPCVLIGSDQNYSHWLLRSLLKVSLIDRDVRFRNVRWLVGEDLLPFQKELLNLLGIQPEQLTSVPRNAVIRCRSLIVPTQMRGNQGFRAAVTWLKDKIHALPPFAETASELLFLSRKDAKFRFLANEDELFESLSAIGFQRIEPGRMTVREQINAFSSAKVIVAPHGASLTNIIFSRPGLHVVEISSSNILHMADFRWIAQELGHRITTIVSSDYVADSHLNAGTQNVNCDYRVSIPEVLKAVRTIGMSGIQHDPLIE